MWCTRGIRRERLKTWSWLETTTALRFSDKWDWSRTSVKPSSPCLELPSMSCASIAPSHSAGMTYLVICLSHETLVRESRLCPCWKCYRCLPPPPPPPSSIPSGVLLFVSLCPSHVSQRVSIYCMNRLQHREYGQWHWDAYAWSQVGTWSSAGGLLCKVHDFLTTSLCTWN